MTVVYLKDNSAAIQAKQWVEYRQKLNPFFTVIFVILCALYSVGAFEFNVLTTFIGFVVFIKVFCQFRINDFNKNAQDGGGK